MWDLNSYSQSGQKFMRSACHVATAAINRYLLPTPDLSSKLADRHCCCRSTGQTDRRTDTRPFYEWHTRPIAGRVINSYMPYSVRCFRTMSHFRITQVYMSDFITKRAREDWISVASMKQYRTDWACARVETFRVAWQALSCC